ncbi:hypothetical protein C0991_005481 [Blastosporella zonata]|nr:hypothetical protein C0991_005481 [Blastosporella zonata]
MPSMQTIYRLCELKGLRVLVTSFLVLLLTNAFLPSAFTIAASPEPHQLNDTDPATCPLCTNPPRGQCNFYADCLESQYHCGPTGYPLGFGEHFCMKFNASRAELSTEGQVWMLNTMECLQQALVPEATSTAGVTCDSLRKDAFASHGPCYVQSGLCTLPPSDWVKIVGIVGVKSLFDSKEAFLATLSAAEGCLEAYLFFLKDAVL